MNSRRKLLVALGAGALAAPLACFAQQQRSKVARIGLLEPAFSSAKWREALMAGLREVGLEVTEWQRVGDWLMLVGRIKE